MHVGDRVETDVASARETNEQNGAEDTETNHVEAAGAVSHEYAKAKGPNDEHWITVTGKHKGMRFQDRSKAVTAH